jgi:hypothetical protein
MAALEKTVVESTWPPKQIRRWPTVPPFEFTRPLNRPGGVSFELGDANAQLCKRFNGHAEQENRGQKPTQMEATAGGRRVAAAKRADLPLLFLCGFLHRVSQIRHTRRVLHFPPRQIRFAY